MFVFVTALHAAIHLEMNELPHEQSFNILDGGRFVCSGLNPTLKVQYVI